MDDHRRPVVVSPTTMRPIACLLFVAAFASIGCATYSEDLNRAAQHYHATDYERALSLFRVLEHDLDSLSTMDRARYAYLRGMTGYRMSFRQDARHWLGIARAIDKQAPGALQADWKERLSEALADLDRDVLGGGEMTDEGGEGPAAGP